MELIGLARNRTETEERREVTKAFRSRSSNFIINGRVDRKTKYVNAVPPVQAKGLTDM